MKARFLRVVLKRSPLLNEQFVFERSQDLRLKALSSASLQKVSGYDHLHQVTAALQPQNI